MITYMANRHRHEKNLVRKYRAGSSSNKRTRDMTIASVVVIVIVALAAYSLLDGSSNSGVISKSQIPSGTPQYQIIEGQQGYPYPYDPVNLTVPAGKTVIIALTDNLGGCGLETIFVGLGVHGGNVVANVPVGSTKYVEVFATSPGIYSYHCGADMYYGNIIAQKQ